MLFINALKFTLLILDPLTLFLIRQNRIDDSKQGCDILLIATTYLHLCRLITISNRNRYFAYLVISRRC
jgi:hypothetical protein